MIEKKYDVTSLGEILIDFTCVGKNSEGKNIFEENPGGAPANCAAAVAKLGGKTAFIGMTGYDSFADNLQETLKSIGVETKAMCKTHSQHTTLAFVTINKDGERNFSFCRNPGADTQLRVEDLNIQILKNTRILHVGSLSLTDEPSKTTQLEAIKIVKQAGGIISYDPNWRESLWQGKKNALDTIKSILPYTDILKISEEELKLLFGKDSTPENTVQAILSYGIKLILITLGSAGAYYASNIKEQKLTGRISVPKVKVIDTTGAGDSFTGGVLYRLTQKENPLEFTESELRKDIEFACATASICVTRRGAIPALPDLDEVNRFIEENMHT